MRQETVIYTPSDLWRGARINQIRHRWSLSCILTKSLQATISGHCGEKITKLFHGICAPATTAGVERFFSVTGHILGTRRTGLSNENYESMLFAKVISICMIPNMLLVTSAWNYKTAAQRQHNGMFSWTTALQRQRQSLKTTANGNGTLDPRNGTSLVQTSGAMARNMFDQLIPHSPTHWLSISWKYSRIR